MKAFRCPRCGGIYFGSVGEIWRNGVQVRGRAMPGDDVRIVARECRNTIKGEPMGRFVVRAGSMQFEGSTAPACRWRGPDSECLVDDV